MGSPPRVRGKQADIGQRYEQRRITPARAGKTPPTARRSISRRDHPRACGENAVCKTVSPSPKGSPPRVRGKRSDRARAVSEMGITPARAGKTMRARCVWRPTEDHPRACGENIASTCVPIIRFGSPPRVRGKPNVAIDESSIVGITPARAGKTCSLATAGSSATDHPRACGENALLIRQSNLHSGSPPRVRGKRPTRWADTHRHGITPARAGKTGAGRERAR